MMYLFRDPRVERVLTSVPFRLLLAVALVGWHVATTISFARARFGVPFDAAPHGAPFRPAAGPDVAAASGDRLVFTRWDGLHYLALALRGYEQCPRRVAPGQDLGTACDASTP